MANDEVFEVILRECGQSCPKNIVAIAAFVIAI